jgi:replicative DNA helicase
VDVRRGFIYEDVDKRIKTYETRKEKGAISGIPFGWKRLDEYTGGHYKQDLTVVFSRTGGGKSRAMHNFAYNATTAGYKTMFVTIEMSGEEICRLYDSRLCKLHYDKIKKGKLTEEEEEKWKSILKLMEVNQKKKGFYVVDIPQGCTVSTIEQEIDDFERRYGKLDCVVVDYILLMQPMKKTKNRNDDVGMIAMNLKALARLRDVSVITATQANREALKIEDGSQIGTEHIGVSDQIAQQANVVLYLYRTPEDRLKNTLKVNIVKYRDGGGHWFELFADWPRNYIGDEIFNLKPD